MRLCRQGRSYSSAKVPFEGKNFEELYASLVDDTQFAETCTALESAIFQYFSSLGLPDTPTLYDHLLLSLRPKDVIATFNWDPFLIQAARRNGHIEGIPRILFLHGNVLDAYCKRDKVNGVRGARCSKCKRQFEPVGLLYPISQKNHEKHPAIRSAWEALKWSFKNAFMVTIFGYGAPQSDQAAVQKRSLEQFEIIDIRAEKACWKVGSPSFIRTIMKSILISMIHGSPTIQGDQVRLTGIRACFIENNPIPRTNNFDELWSWYRPLIDAERSAPKSS